MKRLLILVLCVVFVFFVLGCAENAEPDPREREILVLLDEKKYDEARSKAMEIFAGENKLENILSGINKIEEINKKRNEMYDEAFPSRKLEIQPGSSYKIRGDYVYITGSVKNVSNSAISYFEVVVKILDESGQVVDSDYTNDGLRLEPGEMRSFEIMHRWSENFSEYVLEIGDVK